MPGTPEKPYAPADPASPTTAAERVGARDPISSRNPVLSGSPSARDQHIRVRASRRPANQVPASGWTIPKTTVANARVIEAIQFWYHANVLNGPPIANADGKRDRGEDDLDPERLAARFLPGRVPHVDERENAAEREYHPLRDRTRLAACRRNDTSHEQIEADVFDRNVLGQPTEVVIRRGSHSTTAVLRGWPGFSHDAPTHRSHSSGAVGLDSSAPPTQSFMVCTRRRQTSTRGVRCCSR